MQPCVVRGTLNDVVVGPPRKLTRLMLDGYACIRVCTQGGTYTVTTADLLHTDLKSGVCEKIEGNLFIQCREASATTNSSRVTNLDFLSHVYEIRGYLKIQVRAFACAFVCTDMHIARKHCS